MRRYVGYALIVISIVAWFFPADIIQLIIRQRPVLLGRYSQGQFGSLFLGTLIFWGIAASLFSKKSLRETLTNAILVTFSSVLTLVVVILGSKLFIKANYVEEDIEGTRVIEADINLRGVVRHRPPNQQYEYTIKDKPEHARSYPNAPPGYPPLHVKLTSDEKGYRNINTSLGKNASYNILVVGDSFAVGSNVSDLQAWPALMAEELHESIYNMGVSGANPHEYLNNLVHVGLQMQPKTVVVMIYEGNDFRATLLSETEDQKHTGFIAGLKSSPLTRALRTLSQKHLETVNANAPVPGYQAAVGWMPLALEYGNKTHYYSFRPKRLIYLDTTKEKFRASENWQATAQVIKDFKKLAETKEFKLVIAYAPSAPHVVLPAAQDKISAQQLRIFLAYENKNLPAAGELKQRIFANLDAQEEVVAEYCRQQAISFVSTTKALQRHTAVGVQTYFTYDQHWTPEGNRIVADVIAEHLRREGL